MRFTLTSITLAATCVAAVPAVAMQSSPDALRTYNRLSLRHEERDWRQFRNYDYDRREGGQRLYFANRYYRDGRYYEPRALDRADRIYRGSNDRYYCRRSDGTTGLVHGLMNAGLENLLRARGGSNLLGTLASASGGAQINRSLDSGKLICR